MYKLMVIIFLSWISLCWATDHYVDNTASGGNNGTSWTNAWESFSAINWGSVQPGDYLYVSGGTDSTIYYEQLTVGASGTSGNQITIIAGKYSPSPTGHSGRVIIDGGWTRRYTVDIDDISYITIKGFESQNAERGVIINHTSTGCIIDSNLFTGNTEQGAIRVDGQYAGGSGDPDDWESYDHIIRNNTVITAVDESTQSDGIYLQRTNNVIVDNNFVHERNRNAFNSHSDAIQTHMIAGMKLTNNIFICDSNVQGMPMVLRAENRGDYADSVILYNNFIYHGGVWTAGAPWLNGVDHQENWGGAGDLIEPPTIMIHNTVISNGTYIIPIWFERNDDEVVSRHRLINNIVVQFGDGVTGGGQWHDEVMRGNNLVADSITGGLYYNAWDDFGIYGSVIGSGGSPTGSCPSWSSWVNTYGGTGVYGDPLFVNPIGFISDQSTINGELQVGSPAINAGLDIQAIVEGMGFEWKDINGNDRDSTPDIGAYEYVSRGPDITPPEVTGAVLLDSVTLRIMFSEVLEQSSAEDENNYSISNNIDIFNASLNGSDVTLQTTTHSPGSYIVTVVNVEDLAGNPIDQSNTAEYSRMPPIPADSLIMFTVEDVYGVIQEPEHTPLKTIDGLGALNGDPDSRWAAEPMPEELIFDLGLNRTVLKTKLSFYRWNLGRVYNYSILISSDSNNWVTIVSQATSASNEEWTIEEFPAVDARYVQVHFSNNNQSDWAGLWEGEIWGIIPSVVDPINNGLPNEFSLHQNYPNPFNPSTKIRFFLPKDQSVKLSVFNILGELISELTNREYDAGTYTIDFDGSALTSGIYFYRIETPEFVETKKMILMQ